LKEKKRMKVREMMTTDVTTATPDTTLEEIATLMRDENIGSIPIVDDDELMGIITDRDIVVRCIAEGKDAVETEAEDLVSGELVTIEPEADAREAARLMGEKQIRRLPVVENGRLVGMLALGDVAVKGSDEETSGEALEEVSQGVKGGRGQKMQPASAGMRGSKMAGRQEKEEGEEMEEGRMQRSRGGQARVQQQSARGGSRGGSSQRQGITNRPQGRENERQKKVNPMRAGKASGRQGQRRRAS
jgi:CBS domain-containing protein